MGITIVNRQKKIPIRVPALIRAVRKVLQHEGIERSSLCVVFVSDPAIKQLNQKFLRHRYVTDVLTFDYSPLPKASRPKALHGEIIVAPARARAQAKFYGTAFDQELTLCVVHGVLHLLGFNDHRLRDIRNMRRKERELMRMLKMPLPDRNV